MSKPEVLIRNASPMDLPSIHHIERVSFTDPYSYVLLLQLLLRNPETFIVAESGEQIVAYAVSSIEHASVGHIVSIAVRPDLRRKGIASLLLDTLEKRMSDSGVRSFALEVSEDNLPAQKLYEKRGYCPTARLRAYYPSGKDAVQMMKKT